jgi:AhpD family alkylhydroperoxidase
MTHVNIGKVYPAAYQAMLALDAEASKAARAAGLDAKLVELVKIRASQINGCAFCLRMHTRDAIAHGEAPDRLAVLAAWWESQYFTDAERAALTIVEQATLVAGGTAAVAHGIDPAELLSDEQIAAVTWLAVTINAWNRIAVMSHYPVAPE